MRLYLQCWAAATEITSPSASEVTPCVDLSVPTCSATVHGGLDGEQSGLSKAADSRALAFPGVVGLGARQPC